MQKIEDLSKSRSPQGYAHRRHLSFEKFTKEINTKYPNKFCFKNTEVSYKNSTTGCDVLCIVHNVMFRHPLKELLKGGKGCKQCGIEKNKNNEALKKTKFTVAHFLDDSKFEYIDIPPIDTPVKTTLRVTIKCKKHGDIFNTKLTNHRESKTGGCPSCAKDEISKTLIKNRTDGKYDNYITWFYDVYPDYEFEMAGRDKVNVYCPECDEVVLKNAKYLSNRVDLRTPCKSCNLLDRGFSQQTSLVDFNDEVESVKKGFYISLPEGFSWKGLGRTKDVINHCPEGHTWTNSSPCDIRRIDRHCPICNCGQQASVGELELLEFVKSKYSGEIKHGDKNVLGGNREIDIYLPDLKLAFEYNGLYYHSIEMINDKNYHKKKSEDCAKKGIRLVHIWADDWRLKRNILENFILNAIGSISKKVYARKCVIQEISHDLSFEFLEEFHIQGGVKASLHLGIFDKEFNALQGVCSFTESKDLSWELVRYSANEVVGGLGKCVSYFCKNFEYSTIKSFCDLSMFMGGSYEKVGFIKDIILPPDYKYVRGDVRFNKRGFRKDTLLKKYPDRGLLHSMTEFEMVSLLKIKRVYDCGKIRYILNLDK